MYNLMAKTDMQIHIIIIQSAILSILRKGKGYAFLCVWWHVLRQSWAFLYLRDFCLLSKSILRSQLIHLGREIICFGSVNRAEEWIQEGSGTVFPSASEVEYQWSSKYACTHMHTHIHPPPRDTRGKEGMDERSKNILKGLLEDPLADLSYSS